MNRHPAKHELIQYAESLVDNSAISAELGGHINKCSICSAEVNAMRNSLELADLVPKIDVSSELTESILMAAHNQRPSFFLPSFSLPFAHARGIALVAVIILVAATGFTYVYVGLPGVSSELNSASSTIKSEMALVEPNSLEKINIEIETLTAAVATPANSPQNWIERQCRREALALDTDLDEARAALERNPRCRRASNMMVAKLQRQAENLRTLYIEKNP